MCVCCITLYHKHGYIDVSKHPFQSIQGFGADSARLEAQGQVRHGLLRAGGHRNGVTFDPQEIKSNRVDVLGEMITAQEQLVFVDELFDHGLWEKGEERDEQVWLLCSTVEPLYLDSPYHFWFQPIL